MYHNLKAEMARKNVSLTSLANALGITIEKMALKAAGKCEILVSEAVTIKKYLNVDMPLDVLFERKEA